MRVRFRYTWLLMLVGVLAAVLLAYLLVANTAVSIDEKEVKRRNTVERHEGETIEVRYRASDMPTGTRRRNTVHHFRGHNRWVGAAGPTWPRRGCRGIITIDRAYNRWDEFLFLIQVRGSWCWRRGHVKTFSFTRSAQRGDQWWNYFGSDPVWRKPVRGVHNDHVYNRQNAVFQVKWFGQVIKDEEAWVSQTLRGNGTSAWDYKDHLNI